MENSTAHSRVGAARTALAMSWILTTQACALTHTERAVHPPAESVDGGASDAGDAARPPEASANDPEPAETPCGADWVREGDACVRWRLAPPYPRAECGATAVRGMGAYGGPLVRCEDRGFAYDPHSDAWYPTRGYEDDRALGDRVAPAHPGERRLIAALWGGPGIEANGALVMRGREGHWRASHARWVDGRERATLEPPVDFDVLLPMNWQPFGQAIAAGPLRSAIYERRPLP